MLYTCNNVQTYEQKLLDEKAAFALDKRLWAIRPWSCTDGFEKPAIKYPAVNPPPKTSTSFIDISSDNPIYKYCEGGKLQVTYNGMTWDNLSDSKISGRVYKSTEDNVPLDKSFIKNGRKAKPKYHKKYMYQKDNETRSYKVLWTYRTYKVVSLDEFHLRIAAVEHIENINGNVYKEAEKEFSKKVHYYNIPMDEFGTLEFDISTELGVDRIYINMVTCKSLVGKYVVFNGVKNNITIKDNTGEVYRYFF